MPVVKELFRESIGVHTCDRRRSKTYIHETYPTYVFEEGFAETDPLWNPITRETDSAEDARSKTVLDDVFSHDDNTYISITAHSGTISSILRGGLFFSISFQPFKNYTMSFLLHIYKEKHRKERSTG